MRKNNGKTIGFVIIRIIAAGLLIWALDKHPYDYYILLRWVVCGVAAFGMYYALEVKREIWVWPFGIIGLLFNPIIPIHLSRSTWQIIDLVVACIFFMSIFLLRQQNRNTANE